MNHPTRPCALLALLLTAPLLAHAPHDVVNLVAVSPAYTQDRTLLALIQLSDHPLLARSQDGGRSWIEYGAPPVGQTVLDLVFSPDFATDGLVFAGTGDGGVWRSADGGLTWEPCGAGLADAAVHEVAPSPAFGTDRTLLAATDAGLWRSADGGDTWAPWGVGLLEASLTSVAFAPDDAQVVFTGNLVLHGSLDGGATFEARATFPHSLACIAVSPRFGVDGVVAAAFRRAPGGVQLSVDAGVSWQPWLDGLDDAWVNDIALADDGTCFAATASDGCFRADAPLGTWTLHTEGLEEPCDQTASHWLSVACSPAFGADGQVFLGAFEGFFSSTDRGATWTQADLYHQRINRRMALSPAFATDGELWIANYGGGPACWRPATPARDPQVTTELGAPLAGPAAPPAKGPATQPLPPPPVGGALDTARGSAWAARADGVKTLHGSALELSPAYARDRTVYYGYVGLWRSRDSGRSWTQLHACPATFIRGLALSPAFATTPTLFVGSGGDGSFRSRDGGDSWELLGGGLPGDAHATMLAVAPQHPLDPAVFLATQTDGLWRSDDDGDTWTDVSAGLDCEKLRAVAMSPTFATDDLVLAGTVGAGLRRSDDRGASWQPLLDGLRADDVIQAIAFSPDFAADRTVFVASLYDGVRRSCDGGWTFAPAAAGLPPDAPRVLCASPGFARDHTLFVATHDWVWRSCDRGDSWQRLPGYARVDERHHAVSRSGAWTAAAVPGSHGAGVQRSDRAGDWCELSFLGDSLTWYAVRDPSSGMAEVVVDGQLAATVDLYAPDTRAQRPVFSTDFDGVGWHRVRIRVTGVHQPASSGAHINTDGFACTY